MVSKVNAASVARSERVIGRADCDAGDAVGDIVRITGPKVGGRYQVEKIDITVGTDPPAVAVVVKKLAATDCMVQFLGPLRGIYAGLSAGDDYVVGTDARPAKVGDANYPGVGVYTQQIGVATSSDELLLVPLGETASSSGDHEGLDTLVHSLAEDSFTEYVYTGSDLTKVIVWTDVGKTLKIRESTFSYTGTDLTGVVVDQYDGAGLVVSTLTKTLTYVGGDLTSVTMVKS